MSQYCKGRGATYHLNKDYATKVFQLDVVDDEDFSDSESNLKVYSKNAKVDTKSGNDDSNQAEEMYSKKWRWSKIDNIH